MRNMATPKVDEFRRSRLPEQALARGPIVIHDLEVYGWEGHDRNGPFYAAAAYVGNQGKPIWYRHFRTDQSRDQAIAQEIRNRRAKGKYKKEKKQYVPFRVGQILETSWGYDQTNVDFFEVIAVRGAVADIQEVGTMALGQSPSGAQVVPDLYKRGKVFRSKRMQGYEGRAYVNMGVQGMATLWNGDPAFQTPFGGGH